jgi:hypothetical protein
MIILRNILAFITDTKNTRMLLLGGIVVLVMLLMRQCNATAEAKGEADRISNNWKASQDTVRNYVDRYGNAAAEIRALNLTLEEVEGELEFEKNRPPVTVIKYKTQVIEKIVEVPVEVIDTVIGNFSSALAINQEDSWGNSSRKIGIQVPYSVEGENLTLGGATIDLQQNIWLTASILRDKKTKEVFVNLSSDYPGTTFNSANGIMIDPKSSGLRDLQYQNRKTFGLGLQIGFGLSSGGTSPYVGVGLNYTPKFLQW